MKRNENCFDIFSLAIMNAGAFGTYGTALPIRTEWKEATNEPKLRNDQLSPPRRNNLNYSDYYILTN